MDSMSSSENAASAYADVRNGWARTNNAARSVMSHPLALPLLLCLRFFDDIDATDKLNVTGDHFMSYLLSLRSQPEIISPGDEPSTEESSPLNRLKDMAWLVDDLKFTTTVERVLSTFPLDDLHSALKGVVEGWMSRTGIAGNEQALVTDILETFCKIQRGVEEKTNSASSLLFQSKGGVVKFKDKACKNPYWYYDLLVARHEHNSLSCSPILLFQFGLDNSMWWQKLDQAYNYLDLMTSPENIEPIKELNVKIEPFCDKPILLSTITIDKETGAFRIAIFLCSRKLSKESKKVNNTKIFVEGFNVILLWRAMWNPDDRKPDDQATQQKTSEKNSFINETKNVIQEEGKNSDNPGLNEFAKALVAIFVAMQCMENWQTIECNDNFFVLGPDCCKVTLVQVRRICTTW
jgi:hypothetical protein